MKKNFISYSPEDTENVGHLISELEIAGHEIWQRKDALSCGENWKTKIVELIDDSDSFLICLSPSAVYPEDIQKELDLAELSKKNIIPVELKITDLPRGMRYQLAGLHIISFVSSFLNGVEELLATLNDENLSIGYSEAKAAYEIKQNPKFIPYSTDENIRWYGHHITLRKAVRARYLWLASDTTLYIDGYKIGQSGGFSERDIITASFMHRGRTQDVLCTSKGEDYYLEINSKLIQHSQVQIRNHALLLLPVVFFGCIMIFCGFVVWNAFGL